MIVLRFARRIIRYPMLAGAFIILLGLLFLQAAIQTTVFVLAWCYGMIFLRGKAKEDFMIGLNNLS